MGNDPLKKEIEVHPNILSWEHPWTEEPGWLHSMKLQESKSPYWEKNPVKRQVNYMFAFHFFSSWLYDHESIT